MATTGSGGTLEDMFGWMRGWPFAAAPLFAAPSQLAQAILPDWSLIRVDASNSSAPDTERRIVAQDSYGRQIGRMMDAVEALIAERPADAPPVKAFAELAELKARVDKVKLEAAAERLARVAEDLAALKAEDPDEYARQAAALKAVLEG